MASIVFKDVSFAYDASRDGLLSHVSFGLSEGWAGVIGANGTGKTTLLRLACGELSSKVGSRSTGRRTGLAAASESKTIGSIGGRR